jgi:hypothetical protein
MTCSNKIRWYDWLIYRLFLRRWNPIFNRDRQLRKVFIAFFKAYDGWLDIQEWLDIPLKNFTVIVNPGVDVENQVG